MIHLGLTVDNVPPDSYSKIMVNYKYIPEYPGYRVGDDGSVWSLWVGSGGGTRLGTYWRQLKTPPNEKGYQRVNLIRDGKPRSFRVHRLVLLAFVGPCPKGMQARHLNGNSSDNRLANIAWGTPEENYADIHRHGTYHTNRHNRRFTHEGQAMSLKQWANHKNVSYKCLHYRVMRAGMPFSEAISRPFLGLAGNGKKPHAPG